MTHSCSDAFIQSFMRQSTAAQLTFHWSTVANRPTRTMPVYTKIAYSTLCNHVSCNRLLSFALSNACTAIKKKNSRPIEGYIAVWVSEVSNSLQQQHNKHSLPQASRNSKACCALLPWEQKQMHNCRHYSFRHKVHTPCPVFQNVVVILPNLICD